VSSAGCKVSKAVDRLLSGLMSNRKAVFRFLLGYVAVAWVCKLWTGLYSSVTFVS
jgi:hypothetical protein